MDLNEVSVFIKVVQSGSFTKAAAQLQMPNSTVSARISSLEKRLGVTLLRRTTRKLHLTEAGHRYFDRCLQGLEQILSAETEVTQSQAEPQGKLKITAPVELGSTVLPEVVAEFLRKNPKVEIEVYLTDRVVDLVSEGIDLAVRMGDLKDSSLMARKLGSISFSMFASPLYLKSRKPPVALKDLIHHQVLQFTPLGKEIWNLQNKRSQQKVPVPGRMLVNDVNMLRTMVLQGEGIALLPTFLCSEDLDRGRFVQILPEWRSNVQPVHFVYPGQKFLPPGLKSFLEMAAAALKAKLQNLE